MLALEGPNYEGALVTLAAGRGNVSRTFLGCAHLFVALKEMRQCTWPLRQVAEQTQRLLLEASELEHLTALVQVEDVDPLGSAVHHQAMSAARLCPDLFHSTGH